MLRFINFILMENIPCFYLYVFAVQENKQDIMCKLVVAKLR